MSIEAVVDSLTGDSLPNAAAGWRCVNDSTRAQPRSRANRVALVRKPGSSIGLKRQCDAEMRCSNRSNRDGCSASPPRSATTSARWRTALFPTRPRSTSSPPTSTATASSTSSSLTRPRIPSTSCSATATATFQPAVQIAVGEAIEGREFVGDFNNDGKLDLFLPGPQLANHAIVLLGNGNGTFQPRSTRRRSPSAGTLPAGWCRRRFHRRRQARRGQHAAEQLGRRRRLYRPAGQRRRHLPGWPRRTLNALHYSRWSTAARLQRRRQARHGDRRRHRGVSDQTGTASSRSCWATATAPSTPAHITPARRPTSDENIVVNPEDVVARRREPRRQARRDRHPTTITTSTCSSATATARSSPPTAWRAGVSTRDVVIVDVNADGLLDLVVTNVGVGPGGAALLRRASMPGLGLRAAWQWRRHLSMPRSNTTRSSIPAGRPSATSTAIRSPTWPSRRFQRPLRQRDAESAPTDRPRS